MTVLCHFFSPLMGKLATAVNGHKLSLQIAEDLNINNVKRSRVKTMQDLLI